MKIIPKINIPTGTHRLDTPTKCKTCAYHTPSTEDEDEMTKMYHAEKPLPHPCHERKNGWVCKGSLESFQRLGLEIQL
jgi:hypothetical protein